MKGEPTCLQDAIDYDAERDEYHARFDSDIISPSVAVVSVIAAITDRDPTELEPLYEAVDPEALDRLCATTASGPENGGSTFEFTYDDYGVRVESYGIITAWPLSDGDDESGA